MSNPEDVDTEANRSLDVGQKQVVDEQCDFVSCKKERNDIFHLRNRIDRFTSNARVEIKEITAKKDTAVRP